MIKLTISPELRRLFNEREKTAKQPEIIKEQQDAYEYIDNTPDYLP